MTHIEALGKISKFIHNHFDEHLSANRLFHNLQHTQQVAETALQIAQHYKLDSKKLFIVQTASWFHDVNFLESPVQHEKKAAQIAEKFLEEISVDKDSIKSIKSCIIATMHPQKPKNLMERIVCDAAMFHFGREDFAAKSKLLRKELYLITGKKTPKEEWIKRNTEFLQNHRFKTDYAKELFGDQQTKNMKEFMDKGMKKTNEIIPQKLQDSKLETAPNNHQPKTEKRPDRGIDTMFRISSNNHQALSQMADSKAHIMITVNSIIISVLLSVLFRSLDKEVHLAIPVALLLVVNVITIVFSILATRPNIPRGSFSKEELNTKKVNLLFFGNYYRMNLDDFSDGMGRLMEDRDFLYSSLIKNLHQQGLVLGSKYKLLRISYNVFMYGLIASVIAFGIAVFLKQY